MHVMYWLLGFVLWAICLCVGWSMIFALAEYGPGLRKGVYYPLAFGCLLLFGIGVIPFLIPIVIMQTIALCKWGGRTLIRPH